MKINELRLFLYESGGIHFKPVCKTWFSVFVFVRNERILVILFRKGGVDFKYIEDGILTYKISNSRFISFCGGDVFRNYYKNASVSLHKKCFYIVEKFLAGANITDRLNMQEGESGTPRKSKVKSVGIENENIFNIADYVKSGSKSIFY